MTIYLNERPYILSLRSAASSTPPIVKHRRLIPGSINQCVRSSQDTAHVPQMCHGYRVTTDLNTAANILAGENAAEVAKWVWSDAPVQVALFIALSVASLKTCFG